MNQYKVSRASLLAAQSIDWLVLVMLLAVWLPPIFFRHHELTVVSRLNLLDDSWLLDTSYKAAGGIWFGRDVAFTYGPLYQWLSSAPARWIGISTGAILATSNTLPYLALILATFCTIRLLLPSATAWRRALLLVLAVVFWSPADLRAPLCLLAFAIFLRLLPPSSNSAVAWTSRSTAGTSPRRSTMLRAIVAAAICVVAFLVSSDTGLYVVAALVLCLPANAIASEQRRPAMKFLLVAAAAFFLLMLLTNAVMFSALDFTFWRSSLAMATGYRWFEPLGMAKADKHIVVAALALGIVVFGACWWRRRPDGPWTRRPDFLLAGFCLALVMMQTALVRSDHGHVVMGIFPMVFLCGAIVLDKAEDDSRLLAIALPLVAVLTTLFLAHPFAMFVPRSMASRWQQIVRPMPSCLAGMQEFDRACFPSSDAELLAAVSSYVRTNTSPSDPIAVFPYETAFGVASRRQVAGGLLQSYLVNGPYLTGLEVDGLRRAAPPSALYLRDGAVSIPIDGVPNFTRSPDLWFYWLRHYRAQGSPAAGVIGLTREDVGDARLTLREETMATETLSIAINQRSTSIDLGAVGLPTPGADFLKMRLRVAYPFWWRLRKPSRLTLQMSFADGSQKSIQFVVEPNRTSEVWVYPWDDQNLGRYFYNEALGWRQTQHASLTRLQLLITPFDWISVAPSTIRLESIQAVSLSLN